MWSIIGLVGLAISFSGATLMASKGVKSEDEILKEAAPRLPVGGPPDSNQYKKSLREMQPCTIRAFCIKSLLVVPKVFVNNILL